MPKNAFFFSDSIMRTRLSARIDPIVVSTNTEENKKSVKINKEKEAQKSKRHEPEMTDTKKSEKVISKKEAEKAEKDECCLTCGKPYDYGERMIQCDGKCEGWYHIECVNVKLKDFNKLTPKSIWKCKYCLSGIDPPHISKITDVENARKKKKH